MRTSVIEARARHRYVVRSFHTGTLREIRVHAPVPGDLCIESVQVNGSELMAGYLEVSALPLADPLHYQLVDEGPTPPRALFLESTLHEHYLVEVRVRSLGLVVDGQAISLALIMNVQGQQIVHLQLERKV